VAAGGEHDRVGVEDRPLAGEQVERAPKQVPSATSSWETYWSSATGTPSSATFAASVSSIARPVQSPA
jgi:hypothetical protein